MAQALQCPQCGHKHRLDALGPLGATIRCERCAQALRVPEQFRAPEAVAVSAGATSTAGAPSGVDATVLDLENSLIMAAIRPDGGPSPRSPRASVSAIEKAPGRPHTVFDVRVVRMLVWVVATAVGAFVISALGRRLGYLTKDQGLEIVNGDSILARYGRLAILVVIWAVTTATLVHACIEGGRALIARQRAVQADQRGDRVATEERAS